MTARPVVHSTFVLERSYEASPARVFAAWADREAKGRWFACHAEYTLDFRVGGGEFTRGRTTTPTVIGSLPRCSCRT